MLPHFLATLRNCQDDNRLSPEAVDAWTTLYDVIACLIEKCRNEK